MTPIGAIWTVMFVLIVLATIGGLIFLIVDQVKFSRYMKKRSKERARESEELRQRIAQIRQNAFQPVIDRQREEWATLAALPSSWTNEYVEAYKVIAVSRTEDDGLWLGHPHPDGPSSKVEPLQDRHAIGPTHTATCEAVDSAVYSLSIPPEKTRNCEESPGLRCESDLGRGCGWYGYKTIKDALVHLGDPTNTHFGIAKVRFSGTIIEYEAGYRAQYMDVLEIIETPELSESVFHWNTNVA